MESEACRFIVQFADKSCKRISKDEAKALMASLSVGKPCVLRGAFFQPHFISAVKPITKTWFNEEFVQQQERLSQDSSTFYLTE